MPNWLGLLIALCMCFDFLRLGASMLVFKNPFPAIYHLTAMPSLAWVERLIGSVVILGFIITGPKIRALALFGILLAGQLIASVLIDYFGWLDFSI
jgi:transporter family-2 protein